MTTTTPEAGRLNLTGRDRTIVFGLVGAGHAMSHVFILALPPLFALIKADLGISYAALGLMVTMFHVATGVMQVPAGFLVDHFGARTTLIVGMLLSAACMGAIGAADTFWMMVGLSMLAGVGNSVFHPADYAIVAAAVDHKHLGKAFSYHLLTGNLGFAVAPVLMASLAALWDWRTALVAIGGVGVAVGVCMLVFGHNLRAGTAPARNGQTTANTGGAQAPASSARALASPALLVMLAFFILVGLANSGIQTFSVTVLSTHYGVALGTATTALTVYLSAGFVGIAVGGLVADRLTRPLVVVVISMATCAACLALIGATALPVAVLLGAMALGGAAVGIMRPARDMMVHAITPPGATGKAFGFVGTGLSVGGAVAPVTFGWLVDIGAAAWVFWLCVLFVLLSIVTAVAVDRMARAAPAAIPTGSMAE